MSSVLFGGSVKMAWSNVGRACGTDGMYETMDTKSSERPRESISALELVLRQYV